jgi:hypothetical protein
MEKKTTRKNSRLADDIRESLREASNYASGKTTKAIVHRVSPKETEAREARLTFGLSQGVRRKSTATSSRSSSKRPSRIADNFDKPV